MSQLAKDKNSNAHLLKIEEGRILKIRCKAAGNPTPKIHWLMNGKKIDTKNNDNIKIDIKDKRSYLIIKKITMSHSGNYSCTAFNNNGTLSKWIFLEVIPKSQNKPITNMNKSNYSNHQLANENKDSKSINKSNTKDITLLGDKTNGVKSNTTVDSDEATCSYFGGCVHGKCQKYSPDINQYYCSCDPFYTGPRCSLRAQPSNTSELCYTSQNNKEITMGHNKIFAIVGFSFSVTLVIFLFSLLCFYKFRRRPSTYISGVKCRKVSNKSIQVNLQYPDDYPFKPNPSVDPFYSSYSQQNPYANNNNSTLSDLALLVSSNKSQKLHYNTTSTSESHPRSPPSGDSSSSHEMMSLFPSNTRGTGVAMPPHNLLLSVNNIPYHIFPNIHNSPTFNNNSHNNNQNSLNSQSTIIHLDTPTSNNHNFYNSTNNNIYSTLPPTTTSHYTCATTSIQQLLTINPSVSFSCTDPCCCLNSINSSSLKLYSTTPIPSLCSTTSGNLTTTSSITPLSSIPNVLQQTIHTVDNAQNNSNKLNTYV